jgi:hypothetical protein
MVGTDDVIPTKVWYCGWMGKRAIRKNNTVPTAHRAASGKRLFAVRDEHGRLVEIEILRPAVRPKKDVEEKLRKAVRDTLKNKPRGQA